MNINIPVYSPEELTRLELLLYPNPSGLHPIEVSWRDLSRKLKQHCEELQRIVEHVNAAAPHYNKLKEEDWTPFKFPTKFEPQTPTVK
jgi:hypothetical protein